MTRRAARITHDEVRRAVKAVQACGLTVGSVEIVGDRVRVHVNNGDISSIPIDPSGEPETVHSLDEYKAWRERSRDRGD